MVYKRSTENILETQSLIQASFDYTLLIKKKLADRSQFFMEDQ